MATDADPYRTLGLPRGATLDEVKRAYRRLAKVNHPDAAGESALPRFLAIQAAYEQLAGGGSGKGRRTGPEAPRRPWEAEPERSDATRRPYGGRARSAPPGAGGTSSGSGGPAGPAGTTGTPPGAGEPARGWAGRRGAAREPGSASGGNSDTKTGRPGRRRTYEPRPGTDGTTDAPPGGGKTRAPNKATLGSTSYDGVGGPFEPDWGGASWYGTTSGTYWTLNPKEYADPRKHGPEYQARARRSARGRATAGETGAAGETGTAESDQPAEDPIAPETMGPTAGDAGNPTADPTADRRRTPHGRPGGPTHTTTSWWNSTAGAQDADDAPPFRPSGEPPPDLGRAAAEIVYALTDDRFGGVRGRFVRAIVGWLPIALGLGWVVGELTGCGRFAATCNGAGEPILLALQVVVFAVLLVVPVAASAATSAAVSLFVAAVVGSLILSATGGAADFDSRQAALGLVLVIGWLIGLAFAVGRRVRTLRSATRPVS